MKKIKPVIVLFAICVIVTALVGFTNELTKDIIAENRAKSAASTMRELIPSAQTFDAVETASAKEGYAAKDATGSTVGYIFVTVGSGGYGGDVTVMAALNSDGVVTGVAITEDSETQGLGKNAHNEGFRSQYANKNVDEYTVVKGAAGSENEISALTGATMTSRAVTRAVNLAKSAYKEVTAQ